MANVYGYFHVRPLSGMNTTQQNQLRAEMMAWGEENTSPYPNRRLQTRLSLNGVEAILEGVFNDNLLAQATLRNQIANILGVPPGQVKTNASTETIAGQTVEVITYSNNGNTIDYAQIRKFGFASWELSNEATRAYLAANAAQWETGL